MIKFSKNLIRPTYFPARFSTAIVDGNKMWSSDHSSLGDQTADFNVDIGSLPVKFEDISRAQYRIKSGVKRTVIKSILLYD